MPVKQPGFLAEPVNLARQTSEFGVIADQRALQRRCGAVQVAKSPPDGYTLLAAMDTTLVLNPATKTNLPYDPFKDFAPITLAAKNTSLLSVLVCDLDGFKTINDSLGHSAGDALLKQVAERLLRASRGTDTVARPGGDEFMIVMDCDLAGATAQLERLQKWVFGDYTIRPGKGTGEVKVHVDAAIGLTEWQAGQTLKEVVEHADAAMYQKKQKARAQKA